MWLICRRRVIAEVYPCHGTCPVKPELIGQLYEAAGDVLAGKVQGKAAEMHGNPIMVYDVGVAGFLCEP